MSDVDERIRELLNDRAGDIPSHRPTPPNLQSRVRRRIALVMGSAGLGIAVLAFATFAGVRTLTDTGRRTPALPDPTPPAVGTLAFIVQDGLVVAASDGSQSHVVRPGPYFGFEDYEWSPDGTRIAIISGAPAGQFEGSAMDLAVVNTDGSAAAQLSDCTGRPAGKEQGNCEGLSWSPDGARIAFSAEGSLFVVELATGSVRQITGCTSCEYDGAARNPAWSPRGSIIAFSTNSSIDVVATDGSGWRRLAHRIGPGQPEWSPDGDRIVFGANDGVWVVNEDGSDLTQLLDQDMEETPNAPTWSPDGTRIAYITTPSTGRDGFVAEVWVMNADGTEGTRLYESPCCSLNGWGGPAWSPHGRAIAFSVWVNAYAAVYVIEADGSDSYRFFGFGEPVWKPTP